ncbi:hypothetical protein [Natrarchaeobius chitinivorans]|uniref:Uncharacterized protein n=1 Tax=Natrarchaeobius chitinivorans TaxID=1679083 RepID=A0A3N6MJL4_NATCH|nr:hypothetical protein [Natrarchaeobius chitinivorans]RQG96041.1 hypothetical protein EA473_07675 [Natrarchaeobius chitinivorans]
MRIITHTCTQCGTVVSANELESSRVMKCPGLSCDNVLRFAELPEEERRFFLEHADQYEL